MIIRNAIIITTDEPIRMTVEEYQDFTGNVVLSCANLVPALVDELQHAVRGAVQMRKNANGHGQT